MKKKVSNRGVSRGEKGSEPFVSQRVKPTKKEATFLNFSKSQVLGQTNLGATPRRFAGRKKAQCLTQVRGRMVKPTLSQTWTLDEPVSAMCVQSVDAHMSCSSHSDTQFAAFFIDPRAK